MRFRPHSWSEKFGFADLGGDGAGQRPIRVVRFSAIERRADDVENFRIAGDSQVTA